MKMKQKKTLVVFDIDGTLTDSVAQHQSAFVAALQHMGVQEINTDFKVYKHHTDAHIAKVIYELDRKESFSEKLLKQFEDLLHDFLNKNAIAEIGGALKAINILLQHDIAICFATGSLYKPAVYKLAQSGIHFDTLQLSTSNQFEDRESIVKAAIDQAGVYYQQQSFERIISVGDGLWDLLTAQQLGIEFVGIGAKHKEVMTTYGMALHFDDWTTFTIEHLMPSTT
jgi:phosphoglycolate phosphatase-like HAD superfamily hydrolase